LVIGKKLVPVMADSRAIPLVAFIIGFSALALQAPPHELWLLPICVLTKSELRKTVFLSALGLWISVISFYLLGKWFAGSESVVFILDTSGLKSIHDYQEAREFFGGLLPFSAGWLGFIAELNGTHIPSFRDIAIMIGQRGTFNSFYFALLVGVQIAVRALLLLKISDYFRSRSRIRDITAIFSVGYWIVIIFLWML